MSTPEPIENIFKETQYSNSYSKEKELNYSNSTVPSNEEILKSIPDLIPNLDYSPWYSKQLKKLGYERFMYLAAQARKGSDTPAVLFKWMLQNNGIVK